MTSLAPVRHDTVIMAQVNIQRKRVMAQIVRDLTGGLPREKVIVAFGAASIGHGSCISRRSAPFPALLGSQSCQCFVCELLASLYAKMLIAEAMLKQLSVS